jgi:hypothetical protein
MPCLPRSSLMTLPVDNRRPSSTASCSAGDSRCRIGLKTGATTVVDNGRFSSLVNPVHSNETTLCQSTAVIWEFFFLP